MVILGAKEQIKLFCWSCDQETEMHKTIEREQQLHMESSSEM